MDSITDFSFSQFVDSLTLFSWARAAVYVILGYGLAKMASGLFEGVSRAYLGLHQLRILKRLVFYVVFGLFFVSALRELGFKLSVLLGAAGILSVAVGFASQTSASNLISGLFLLGEKPFQIGDTIEVDGSIGEVISIDLLSIKLRTFDNQFVRIPNESIIKTKLTNKSRFQIRRVDITIGVAYKEDVVNVRQLLLDVAKKHPSCLDFPEPICVITRFAESAVEFQFSLWTKNAELLNFKHEILEKVKLAFDEKRIEIPFPHMTLYAGSDSQPFSIQTMPPKGADTP